MLVMKRRALHLALFLLLAACARQTVPTGGPRDVRPPRLIESTPSNKQLNFTGSTIELMFDELVQLNDPLREIIITPRVGKTFEAISRKNKVILTVEDQWVESTTYTINLREAVQDVTERNPAANLKIAFSTGDYIDSLALEGTVIELLKDKPAEEVTVGIVEPTDTFNIFAHEPYWFSKSNKDGEFTIENLKAGEYFLYAFVDPNKNLIVDPHELHGFLGQPIRLDSSLSALQLNLTKADSRPLRVVSARPEKSSATLTLSVNARGYSLAPIGSAVQSCYGESQSEIKVYPIISLNPFDSLLLIVRATDSLNRKLDTTLYIKTNPDYPLSDRFSVTNSGVKIFAQTKSLTTSFSFTKPLRELNPDSLFLAIDSIPVMSFRPDDMVIDSAKNILRISRRMPDSIASNVINPTDSLGKPLPPNHKPNIGLLARTGLFISLEADTSAATIYSKSTIIRPESSAIILANIKCQENFFVQLLDREFNVIDQRTNESSVRFEHLTPGNYQIRVLIDSNKNGCWDPANYFTLTEAEPVIFYINDEDSAQITTKANWEIGPLLITCE